MARPPIPFLRPSPADVAQLHGQPLRTEAIPSQSLFRISAYNSGEPHFGRRGTNRFDAPDHSYGTCYLAFTLQCAFAESVLHNAMAVAGEFKVPRQDLDPQHVHTFLNAPLTVVPFYGPPLRLLNLDGRINTCIPYDIPQAWSQAIHDHPQMVDGIRYISRNDNGAHAVVLFERAEPMLFKATSTPFALVPGSSNVITAFNVVPA
ncbi:RES family NAD+ phosphorylase [Paraburkholderia sediminicola]|uniref:RES family NAD+ phosphorylase n=1 Tax=Paraburkholderia sediminicola TaxID=458836 RepID=UPI0038BC04BA